MPVALVWLVEGLPDQALTGNNTALWAIPLAIVGLYAVNAPTHISRSMITRGVAWELVTANRKAAFRAVAFRPHRQPSRTAAWGHSDSPQRQCLGAAVCTFCRGHRHSKAHHHRRAAGLGLAAAAHPRSHRHRRTAAADSPMRSLQRWLRHSSASELAARSQLRAVLTDVPCNALTIKLSDAVFEQQVEQANQQLYYSKRQLIWHQAISSPLIELVGALIIALTLTIGGQAVRRDSSSGELMAFLVAIGLLSAPLKASGRVPLLWHTASAAAERLFPLLQERKAETSSHPPLPAAPLSIELEGPELRL